MLAVRLKELRKKAGITQEQLAAAIDVERSSVGKYESPTKPVQPSSEVLLKLATYFNVSTDYLLGNGKKEPTTVTGDGLELEVLEMLKRVPPERMDEVKRFLRFQAEQKETL